MHFLLFEGLHLHLFEMMHSDGDESGQSTCSGSMESSSSFTDGSSFSMDNTDDGDSEEGNTATSDISDFMQRFSEASRTVSMREACPFGLACERGVAFRQVFSLTRKALTEAWMGSARDLAFEHYRENEPGFWEKKILGWSFQSYGQLFGRPFAVQLRRDGLWSAQLFDPFETQGYREVHFVTVFPQPIMLNVDGHTKGERDVVVLAMSMETLASDSLPLVVRHGLAGTIEIGSVHCPPGCTPNGLLDLLGYGALYDDRHHGRVYFRLEDSIRIFLGMDRIGLPAGAYIHLSVESTAEGCESELPWQLPLREHQILLVAGASSAADIDADVPLDTDESGLMQFGWQADMDLDEGDFLAGAEALREDPVEYGFYPWLLKVERVEDQVSDVLQEFLTQVFVLPQLPVFTIHVWYAAFEVAAFARVVPLLAEHSYTKAFVREWHDIDADLALWLGPVNPQPEPLSLRIQPIDLVLINHKQKKEGKRLYVVDLLFRTMPKRVAVLYEQNQDVRELVRRVGLAEACMPHRHHCVLVQVRGERKRYWALHDSINEVHGSSFQLEFRSPKPVLCEDDSATFMQFSSLVDDDWMHVHSYVQSWFGTTGTVTCWCHDSGEVLVQSHPMVLDLDLGGNLRQQIGSALPSIPKGYKAVPVEPAPVLLVIPRPHLILVARPAYGIIPVLCQLFVDQRMTLLSIVVNGQYPPIGAAVLFEMAYPSHTCEQRQLCYLISEGVRVPYYADVELNPGGFVRLYIWTQDGEEMSTQCPSDSSLDEEAIPTEDEDAWADESGLLQNGHLQVDYLGDHTATPHAFSGSGYGGYDWQVGGNTATPPQNDHDFRTEEEDVSSLFQPLLQQIEHRAGPAHLQPPTDEALLETQQAWIWSQTIARVVRHTAFWGYDFFEAEAVAFHASRGEWPGVVLCGFVFDEVRFWDAAFDLDFRLEPRSLMVVLRRTLEPPLSQVQDATLAVVKPIPTVDEQNGNDDVYMLVGADLMQHERLALIVIWDVRLGVRIDMHPMVLPGRIETSTLFQLVGLEHRCQLTFILCEASFDGQELPHFIAWQIFHGMKIVIDIKVRPCPFDMERAVAPAEISPLSWDEEVMSLMQSSQRRFCDDGNGVHSAARLQRCCDMGLSWIVPVRMAQSHLYQVWKHTGRDVVREHFEAQGLNAAGLSMSGWIFHDMEQEVGDSFAWGVHSRAPWAMQIGHFLKGTRLDDALLYTVVPQPNELPSSGTIPHQLQVIIPSEIEEVPRQLLVVEHMLTVPLQRMAIRCPQPCRVQDIFHSARLGSWCRSEYRCSVLFHHGRCQKVFYDYDEVTLPFASLILLEVHKVPEFPCEQFLMVEPFEHQVHRIAEMVQDGPSSSLSSISRMVRNVLEQVDGRDQHDDATSFMQLQLESPPLTLSTRSAELSSLDGPQPVPLVWRSEHQASMYTAMAHLWEYWNSCPWYRMHDELQVYCVVFQNAGTAASSQFCPIDYLYPFCSDHNFAVWCRGVVPMLGRPGASVFPVHGDVYVNVPSLLFVEEVAGNDVPFLVHVTGRGHSLLLTYVTSQTVRVMDILHWVHGDFPLSGDISFETSGGRLRQNILVRMQPGSLYRVILHEIRNARPEGGTSYTSESMEGYATESWHSEDGPPAAAVSVLSLPSPLPLIVDRFGTIYGAQIAEDAAAEVHTMVLLQKNVRKISLFSHDRQVTDRHGRPIGLRPPSLGLFMKYLTFWAGLAFSHLSPPGNTVVWASVDMQKMDDWMTYGELEIVCDYAAKADMGCDVQVVPPRSVIQLKLSEFLDPPSTYGDEKHSMALPRLQPFVDSLLDPRERRSCPIDWMCRYLPDEALIPFLGVQFGVCQRPSGYEIFTDGSYMPQAAVQAGWAFVVLAHSGGSVAVATCDWGQVVIDPVEAGWIGAASHDSKAGEMTAMIRALEWAFAHARGVETVFAFDAMSVGKGACGQWGFSRHEVAMLALRSLGQAFEYIQRCYRTAVIWKHTKAHCGTLGNEMADLLAKRAVHEPHAPEQPWPDYFPLLAGKRTAIEQLWLYIAARFGDSGLPCYCQGGLNLDPNLQLCPDGMRLPSQVGQVPVCNSVIKRLKLACLTFNVHTLQPAKSGYYVNYLREQVAACQYWICFLQETRVRTSNLVMSSTHLRYTSEATAGHGGVEIWLLRKHPKTEEILFAKEHVQVLVATSELLILKAKCKGVELLLFTAHAPHTGATKDDQLHFWNAMRMQLKPWICKYKHFIGGMDANAHFDAPRPPFVGECGLEANANVAAEHFLELLDDIEGFLPSTYEEFHHGATGTWCSNANGMVSRCDYFILPQVWRDSELQTYPNPHIDSGAKGVDHVPLALELTLVAEADKHRPARTFDRKKLQMATEDDLKAVFQHPPQCGWTMHVDQHAMRLTEWIRTRLSQVFPPDRTGPRKSYISDDTWKVRSERVKIRREICWLRLWGRNFSLWGAWKSWAERIPFSTVRQALRLLSATLRIMGLRKSAAQKSRMLGKMLKADRTKAVETLGEIAHSLPAHEMASRLRQWGVKSRKKPSHVSPLPIVKGADGTVLATTEQVAERWRSHFAEQEDGIAVSCDELISLTDGFDRPPAVCPTWDQLPTLSEIEHTMRNIAAQKAFFADGVPGDVLRQLPGFFARLFFPLFMKEAAWQREALVFKGGKLVPMYKKGSPADCSNFRSLFVSSPVGKVLHSIYRQELGSMFAKKRLPLQIGGLKGQTIVQATQSLQLFQRMACRGQQSYAILFVDIQNAFYRLARGHLTRSMQDLRMVGELFESMGLPEDALEEFCAHFKDGPVLEGDDVPPFFGALFKEFYESTWFTVTGCEKLTWTRRGSRPGDSLADISFGFAVSRILKNIEVVLIERFHFLTLLWNGSSSPFRELADEQILLGPVMPVWADDIALAFTHPLPHVMLEVAPEICTIVLHSLATAGLRPNMSKGKTELLLELKGPGALSARRKLAMQDNIFDLKSETICEPLHVVGHYRHLGTILQKGGSMVLDLRTKFAGAHDVLTRFRTQVFANRKIDLSLKSNMVRSLVYSTMIFSSALWMPRTQKQIRQLEQGFGKLEKRIAVMHFGKPALEWSGARARAALALPSCELVLREARLRYIMQLIRSGQPQVWHLVQEETIWYAKVQEDLEWLQAFCPDDGVPSGTPQDWQLMMWWAHEKGQAWKRLVRKGVARAKAHLARLSEWAEWHRDIVLELQAASLLPMEVAGSEVKEFFCALCQKCFSSKAAMSVHSFKRHRRVNAVRHYVEGLQCKGCLKHYSSQINLTNHVKRSESCFRRYSDGPCLLDPLPGLNSRAAGRKETTMPDPYFQAEGPLQQAVSMGPFDPVIDGEKQRLVAAWNDALVRGQNDGDLLTMLQKTLSSSFLYPEEMVSLLSSFSCQVAEDGLTLGQLMTLEKARSLLSAAWLFQQGEDGRRHQVDYVNVVSQAAARMETFPLPLKRMPKYHPVIFAHIFSGRRRAGDFQEQVEQRGARAISIDIIFHVTYGDLCRPQTYDLFRRAFFEDVIWGFLGGPPCETWSRARGRMLEGRVAGPRRVRQTCRPTGRLDLTAKEDQQVRFGSRLLGVAVKMLFLAVLTCKTAVLEHPAEDGQDLTQPSIWKLAIFKLLLRFSVCKRVRVLQGHFNATSPKPTEFLLVNVCDEAEQLFVAGRCSSLPKAVSIGLNEKGEWQTAHLKEYPAALCAVLGDIFVRSQPPPADGIPVPDWFLEVCEELTGDFNHEAGMGMDYCGQKRPN